MKTISVRLNASAIRSPASYMSPAPYTYTAMSTLLKATAITVISTARSSSVTPRENLSLHDPPILRASYCDLLRAVVYVFHSVSLRTTSMSDGSHFTWNGSVSGSHLAASCSRSVRSPFTTLQIKQSMETWNSG